MSVTMHFPDEVEIKGPDATTALRRLGKVQWSPTDDVAEIKSRMSDRAWAWSRFTLDPLLPDDEFLTALDASGMCVVVWEPNKVPPKGSPRKAPGHG